MSDIVGNLGWETILQFLMVVGVIAVLARFYTIIFKIDGITGTGKVAKVMRFVIGGISVVASFLGVYAGVFWLTKSVLFSSVIAAFVAGAIDAFSFYSEKAFFMSFYMQSLAQIAFRTFILLVALWVNYYSMVNYGTSLASNFLNKEEKKIAKDVDSAIDYSNKTRIELIEDYKKKKANLKYDWRDFADNESIAKIEAKVAKIDGVINRYKSYITQGKKGKAWYEKEIDKFKAKRITLNGEKEELIREAKLKAKQARDKKIAFYDAEIKRLTDIIESKSIGKQEIKQKQKEIAKKEAFEIKERVENYVLIILVTMVIMSSILFFSSNEPLKAREKAVEFLEIDSEFELKKAEIDFKRELAEKKLEALREGQMQMFLNDETLTEDLSQAKDIFTDKVKRADDFIESVGKEAKEEKIDFNKELFEIAQNASVDGKHPHRDALKELAKSFGLDVTRWTEKYKNYLKEMENLGLIFKDGRGYRIKEKSNEAA